MSLLELPQFGLPFLDILPDLLFMGLAMVFILIAVCGPGISAVSETLFMLKNKPFYDKLGLQTAQLTFWAALPIYFFLMAYIQYSVQNVPEGMSPAAGFSNMLPGMGIPFLWASVFMLYRFTWDMLKRKKNIHLGLGYISTTLSLATLFLTFLAIVCIMQPALTELLWDTPRPTAEVLSITSLGMLMSETASSPASWFFLLYMLMTGLTATACFVLPWLFFQRNRADYGRDYYSFAVRQSAQWAVFAQTGAIASGSFFLFLLWESPLHSLSQPQSPLAVFLACGLPLCCIALWVSIAFGKTPLRHKVGAAAACILFFTALCAQFFTFLSALPVL